mmetsp:Transcript_10968/g.26123  ORF Transcript_10968/g.26123 Transcript_10968/m.26123 type:complete len:308 (+) Transcript_10968:1-924(+)
MHMNMNIERQNPNHHSTTDLEDSTLSDSLLSPPSHDDDDDEHAHEHEHRRIETEWKPSDLKGFISVSAPCSLGGIQHVFQQMGLDKTLVDRIFGHCTEDYDPLRILKNLIQQQHQHHETSCTRGQQVVETHRETKASTLSGSPPVFDLKNEFPPAIKFYHGTNDRTVPYEGSQQFYDELRRALRLDGIGDSNETRGNSDGHNWIISTAEESDTPSNHHHHHHRESHDVQLVLYDGWSHTDPILEGPMDADHTFHYDLFCDVKRWTTSSSTATSQQHRITWPNDDDPVIRDRLCPHFMVVAGRFFMPF